MLQRGVYPYECIDSWEKFNETFLTKKDDFCGHLNMEKITSADYTHAKRVYNNFEIKTLGYYNHFYVQCDTWLLADVFESFWNTCLEVYKLDYINSFSYCTRISMTSVLKEHKSKMRSFNWYCMLLMVEKGITERLCHVIHGYEKLITNTWKVIMKIKKPRILRIGLSQKLPLNCFKCVENTSQFKKDSIKSYIEESDEGFFSWSWYLRSWKLRWALQWITFFV